MTQIKPLKINGRPVGPGYPCYIIFEVASTHTNDWNLAKEYVNLAKQSGADAVKFQLFRADNLLNPITQGLIPTYKYFKKSETPLEWFPKLVKLCGKIGIDLLCTPFDEESANFLDKVGVPAIKVASGDLTNHQLLNHLAKFNKPVILSTGMATMVEVKSAFKLLKTLGILNIALLQCTSVYPMPYKAANLKAIETLKKEFSTVVGFSDNGSNGITAPLVAVALGASIIEKHVTSQKKRGNIDDNISLSVQEFTEMVNRIRQLEGAHLTSSKSLQTVRDKFGKDVDDLLGDGIKRPAKEGYLREDGVYMTEDAEKHWARRGVYPKVYIPKGSKITKDMLISLRPDVGISTSQFNKVVGSEAIEDLPIKHPLFLEKNKVRKFTKKDIKKLYTQKEEKDFSRILIEEGLFE